MRTVGLKKPKKAPKPKNPPTPATQPTPDNNQGETADKE